MICQKISWGGPLRLVILENQQSKDSFVRYMIIFSYCQLDNKQRFIKIASIPKTACQKCFHYQLKEHFYMAQLRQSHQQSLLHCPDRLRERICAYSKETYRQVLISYYGDLVISITLILQTLLSFVFLSYYPDFDHRLKLLFHLSMILGRFLQEYLLKKHKILSSFSLDNLQGGSLMDMPIFIADCQVYPLDGKMVYVLGIILLWFLPRLEAIFKIERTKFPLNSFKVKIVWISFVWFAILARVLIPKCFHYENGSVFEFILTFQVGAFLCALSNQNLSVASQHKHEKYIFLYNHIQYSEMLKLCIFSLYKFSPQILLATLAQSLFNIILILQLKPYIVLAKIAKKSRNTTNEMVRLSPNRWNSSRREEQMQIQSHRTMVGKYSFEEELCICCSSNKVNMIFAECSHSSMCRECGLKQESKSLPQMRGLTCPLCHKFSAQVRCFQSSLQSCIEDIFGFPLEVSYLHGKYRCTKQLMVFQQIQMDEQ